MRGLQFDVLQNYNRVKLKNGRLRLQKMLRTYKNFKKYFYNIWANAFYNYITIFISLFGKVALDLYSTLPSFIATFINFLPPTNGKT